MDFVLRHIRGALLPLASPGRRITCWSSSPTSREGGGLRDSLETVLEAALEAGLVADAAIAESEAQRQAIWKLREEHAEAQKREGASVKNDSPSRLARARLIARASAAARR